MTRSLISLLTRPLPLLLAACAALSLSACAHAPRWFSGTEAGIERQEVETLLRQNPLAAGENIRVTPVRRAAEAAHYLVQVRDAEPLHHHADSELVVFLLRGEGCIRIGPEKHPVRAGDVLHIPRGVVHAYVNLGAEPGVAWVVMSPPPGPNDRVRAGP